MFLNLKEFSKQDLGVSSTSREDVGQTPSFQEVQLLWSTSAKMRCFLLDSLICLYKPFCTSESNAWYGEIIDTWVVLCSRQVQTQPVCWEAQAVGEMDRRILLILLCVIMVFILRCMCSLILQDITSPFQLWAPRWYNPIQLNTCKQIYNTHWVPGFTTLKPAQRRDKAVSNCDEANGSEWEDVKGNGHGSLLKLLISVETHIWT